MGTISNTLSEDVRQREKPIITAFELEQLIYALYRRRSRSRVPSPRAISRLKRLLQNGDLPRRTGDATAATLIPDPDFPASVWRVTAIPDAPPEELVCLVDPWCFVSHLSAMQQWGLSNRSPTALHLTRPKSSLWRETAKAELRTVYPDLEPWEDNLPHPRERVTFPATLRQRELAVFEPQYLGQSVSVPDSEARIATVGQTFRDMLHEPALCGGMIHVLEVWEKHAETYIEEIIEALSNPDSYTTKIAFARAGYILTERMKISDQRVDAWTAFAERGGSRKLDPERPYEPAFSERWMLSVNV